MKLKHLALAFVLSPFCFSAAQAAENPGWETSIMGVYVDTDSNRRDADYGIGLRVGLMKQIADRWHIELAGFGNDIERDKGSGQDWQYGLGVDGLYMLRDKTFNPYVVLGAGGIYSDTIHGTDTQGYWNAGLGVMVREVWGAMSLRADARYFQDYTKDGSGNDPFDDVRFHVGINFPLFGRTKTLPSQVVTVETERVVEVPKVIVEQPEVLHGVNFEFDSERLTVNAKRTLQEVADRLLHHKHFQVEISGHTDSQGSAEYNQQLSERRANAVKDYLVELGVKADRLTTVGYGLTKPIATNDTAEGRETNRRIEMRRLKDN